VIDGCPAGIPLSKESIAQELARRSPDAQSPASTSRQEADEPELLSGVFEGKTLGTPIAILIRNTDQRSKDYEALRDIYRPGHADWVYEAKFGVRDHRGGGRSSGRETAGRVAAGAAAKAFLAQYGVTIRAWSSSIAGISAGEPDDPAFDLDFAEKNPFRVPNKARFEEILKKIEEIKREKDSAGGIVACRVENVPPGLGEPVFDKLDAKLAQAMLSIGAAKGVEFGAGFAASGGRGSLLNDVPIPSAADFSLPSKVPSLSYKTNNAGGVLGGIANGMPLEFKTAFKPTPSIARKQETTDRAGIIRELIIEGRHDVCIVPRAVPVVEAMTALVLADLFLLRRANLFSIFTAFP
jgi:chorismate synthase